MRTRLATTLLSLALPLAFANQAAAELDPDVRSSDCGNQVESARVLSATSVRGVVDFDVGTLELAYAASPSIMIEGPASAIAGITVSNEDGRLKFSAGECAAKAKDSIRVTVAAPSFETISATGTAFVSTRSPIRSSDGVTIDLSASSRSDVAIDSKGEIVLFADGGGAHRFAIEAPSLVALHTGSGELALSGRTGGASLAEYGRGTVASRGLTATHVVVDIDGGGTVTALR